MKVLVSALLLCCATPTFSICQSPCSCQLIDRKSTATCSNSNLKAIPRSLDPDNEQLDLSHNLITILPDNVFRDANLLNLQELNLHSNEIGVIEEDAFRGVVNLRQLDLSNNKISSLKPNTIPRWVVQLNMNGNPLKRLEPLNFLSSPLLRQLSLENCEIEFIHPNALQEAVGLQDLSLRFNKLVHLNETVFKDLRRLKTLRLEDNPWNCECSLRRFRDWYINNNLDAATVTCDEPKSLKGAMWRNLNSFDFVCR